MTLCTESTLEHVNDLATEVTTFEYDDANNLTSLTDPIDNETTWVYDDLNRVTTETIGMLSRTYEYDANSNLVEKTDREGRITNYKYDNLNRLTAEKWYNGMSLARTIEYELDAAGNLTSLSDPDAIHEYTYDALNRVTTAEQTITGLTPLILHERGYDAASRLTAIVATIGGTADYANGYTYDPLDQLGRIAQLATAAMR